MSRLGEIKDRVLISQSGEHPVEVEALFDSGATISMVSEGLARKADLIFGKRVFEAELIGGRKVKYVPAIGIISIKGCESVFLAGVLQDGLTDECIIGVSQMELMGITLDPEKRTYDMKCRLPRI